MDNQRTDREGGVTELERGVNWRRIFLGIAVYGLVMMAGNVIFWPFGTIVAILNHEHFAQIYWTALVLYMIFAITVAVWWSGRLTAPTEE